MKAQAKQVKFSNLQDRREYQPKITKDIVLLLLVMSGMVFAIAAQAFFQF